MLPLLEFDDKHPAEVDFLELDFSAQLDTEGGEALTGTPTWAVTSGSGLTLDNPSLVDDDLVARTRVSSGTAEVDYRGTCTVATTASRTLVGVWRLAVTVQAQ